MRSVRIGIGARPAYRPQHCPARRDYRSECPTDLRHRSYTERSRTGESRFSPRSSFGAVRSGFDPRILFPDLPAAMSAVRRPFRAADRIRPKKRAGIGFGPDSHPPILFSIPARGNRAGRSSRGEGPPSVRAGSADCGLASHRRKAPNCIRSSREEHFGRPTPRTWRRRPSFRRPHSDSPRGREDLQKRTGKRRRTGIAPPCTSREAAEAVCPAGRNGRNANPFTQQIPVRPHRPMCSPRAFGGDRNTFFSSSACIFIGRNHRKGKLFVKTKGKPESV